MAAVGIIDLTLSSPERGESNRSPFTSRPKPSPSTSHKERAKRTPSSNELNTQKPDYKGNEDGLFFVDLTPTGYPSTSRTALPVANGQQENLLLPQHVTVLAGTSTELEVQPLSDLEDDDFIKYIDYEDTKGLVRYFHQSSDEATSVARIVCKNCSAEGSHKTAACRVQICLTCGARDEHSTRSCPISKVCYTCGMKGHIIANCPNRGSSRALSSEHKCHRCSESTHKTNECPTWWRLYEYVNGEDRDLVFAVRQQKRDMKLGEGGEGYVADDEWCYNCGNAGHWGDDCDIFKHTLETEGHSAFSKANVIKGPFYDPNSNHQSTTKSRVRDWGRVDKMSVMADVGRKGRLKSRVALEKQAIEAARDDEDDWFADGSRQKNRPNTRSSHEKAPSRRLSFDRRNNRYAPERSLLDRIEMHAPSRQDSGSSKRQVSTRDPRFDRSNFEDRNRPTYDRRRDHGPRYRGGYDGK